MHGRPINAAGGRKLQVREVGLISGACGRLRCCLKYEHPLYVKAQETVPPRGSEVDTPEGPGRVVDVNVPSETVKVRLRDGGRTCSCSFASVQSGRIAMTLRRTCRPPNIGTSRGRHDATGRRPSARRPTLP